MSQDGDSGEGSDYETAVAATSFVIATLEDAKSQASLTKIIPRNGWEPEKKRENWFWRQNAGTISDDTSSEDNDYDTALAAATFAVATLKGADSEASLNKAKSIQHGPAEFDSKRKPDPVNWRPPENKVANREIREAVDGTTSSLEKKAEAWEKSAIAKIRKRYEKQCSSILSWENKEKVKARYHLDKVEGRLNLRKERSIQAYENEVAIIERTAREERALAAERKRKDELKAKEKAKKIRSAGRVPVTCFCF